MIDTDPLTTYVIEHFSALMTPVEQLAHLHLTTVYKMTDGRRSDADAQREVWDTHVGRRRWMSQDPQVLELAADGITEFRIRTAARILRDHPSEVVLNLCPKCGALTMTPTAKLCLRCGHAWHPKSAV
jgi:hypothetical protein